MRKNNCFQKSILLSHEVPQESNLGALVCTDESIVISIGLMFAKDLNCLDQQVTKIILSYFKVTEPINWFDSNCLCVPKECNVVSFT